MRKILFLIIICSITFPSDLIVNVKPDTILVGSLVSIKVTVENNTIEEVVIFYDIDEDLDNYTVLDKKLSHNSVNYILQFWNAGPIIIPPIAVDIKSNNLDIKRTETEEIKINILSNIVNFNNKMRNIKPMRKLKLTSSSAIILYLITLLTSGSIAILLWKSKRIPKYKKYTHDTLNTSSMQKSIKKITELPLPKNINSVTT